MSVNDADTIPPIADEIAWLQSALSLEVPVLGVCLGAQLLAKAAGAAITQAPHPEVGVSPVTITDPHDPLIGHLAPVTYAMHWHGEQFTLPAGAAAVAHSGPTDVQCSGSAAAPGECSFHLEVDNDLLEVWLAEPSMTAEAARALGDDYREDLRGGLALVPAASPHRFRPIRQAMRSAPHRTGNRHRWTHLSATAQMHGLAAGDQSHQRSRTRATPSSMLDAVTSSAAATASGWALPHRHA